MNITCYHIEPWQEAILKESLKDHNLKLVNEPLSNKNLDKDTEILVSRARGGMEINKTALDKLPNLKLIATMSVGFDHIDLESCKEKKIVVTNVPDYGANTITEQTFALLLSISRKITESVQTTKQGSFDNKDLEGFDLKGKTIGVIGSGKIGLEVIKRARAFDMNIIAFDVVKNEEAKKEYNFEYLELDELLEKSDIITLHAPYNKHTHHLLNNENLPKIRKGTILINTARGGLIDTKALLFLVENKTIKAAGLDVLEDQQSLEVKKLVAADNVYITPHNASNTREARTRILNTTIENIEAFKENKPINVVS